MNALDRLNGYLSSLERRLKLVALTRGAAVLGIAALTATIVLVLVSNAFAFSEPSLTGARLMLFLIIAFAVTFGIILPLLRLNRRRAARRAELKFPDFQERLLTFAERSADRDPFVELLAADTIPVAERVEPARLVPRSWLVGLMSVAAAALVILVWLTIAGPGFMGYGASLLWGGTPRADNRPFYDITVAPGDRAVRRRTDQLVTAQLIGFQSAKVRLLAKYRGTSKWEEVLMHAQQQRAGFEFLFAGLPETVDYYVEAAGVRSKTHTLSVVDLPMIKRVRVTYHFPAWIGLKDAIEDPGGDLRAVEGTEAEVAVLTDRPLRSGMFVLDDETQVPLRPVEGNWLSGKITIKKDGLYHVATTEQGQVVRLSEDYFIEARKELSPIVRISRPGRDAKVNPIEEVTVQVAAEDDFGLQDVALKYSVNGGPEKSVPLLARKGLKEATGDTTIYLEEFKLVPGDVVSMYASARDARATSNTDILFIETQPFEREYSQSQQAGGGGGGGGEQDDSRISQRQKEIIAATWNQIQDKSRDKAAALENAKFLSEVQGKLRDQARSLAQRMRSRELAGANQEFRSFSKDMDAAAQAMNEAVDKLKTQSWKDALPPEQRALQNLLRAEATFRQIQVAFGSRGGGGGGGGGMGRDLESLFDLELDTEKNQYETGQQVSAEQRAREVDEALQKLEQLARRQQELANQQRQNRQSFEQRWQQELLRREAEQLQRQIEQLARGQSSQQSSSQQGQGQSSSSSQQGGQQSQQQQQRNLRQMAGRAGGRDTTDPKLRQALENIEQAARDMRRASSQENPQSDAETRRAAERLQQAGDLLRGMRQQESTDQVGDLVRRAEQLADQQRNFANRLRQMYGNQEGNQLQPGMSRQQAVQLGDEKDKMADEFRDLERRTQAAVRDLAGTQRPAASKLRDALGEAQQDELGLRMKANAEWIRRGLGSYAWMREAPITAGLDKLRDNLRDAQNAMQSGNGDPNDMEKRLSQVERLRNQLQQMARQGQQRGNQRGDQPGQQGQQGRTGQQGQQGQEGGGQQGQEGQQGQQGQSGQGGQGGDRGALSRDGYRQGGARDGRFGGAGGPHGGWWGGYRGDWDGRELRDLDPAQIERGYREGLRDLGQLRQAIQDNPDLARDVQDLIREMQRVDPSRVPGNAELIERIQSVVLPAIEQLELQLRRKLEDKNAGQVRTAGSEPVPAGYADAVAEYFRRLSKSK